MPPRARKTTKPAGPVSIESITHGDKRINLPTADAQEFVTPEIERARRIIVARDVTQDPQLVWRGKYGDGASRDPETAEDIAEAAELVADAPPIYIQEKIDPRVLIENLRRTARAGEPEPEFTLFETFDGLGPLDNLEFYAHAANWSNRMILGDSLQVMGSLAEREDLRGAVQMIYIDPPYGIKFGSNWQASTRSRDVKDGKAEDAAREAEQIKAFRDTWELGIHSYLSYLRDRLLVARELLTESGSCFVQIGDENVHLVRSLMDEVFGSENYLGQVSFATTAGATSEFLANVSGFILWFGKDRNLTKYHPLFIAKADGIGTGEYRQVELADGTRTSASAVPDVELVAGRLFRFDNLTSQSIGREKGEGAASWFPVEVKGRSFRPPLQARWKTNQVGMQRLLAASRVHPRSDSLAYVRFLDDFPAMAITATWSDTAIAGRPGDKIYVVQTSPKVIERCLLMCTDPGDLVIDPTCGSGTTAYVAEQWGRRWITIDTSRVALALARQRIMGARFPYYLKADSAAGRRKITETTGQPPAAAPPSSQSLPSSASPSGQPNSGDIRQGFVYERVQHITLKSIANNPDIHEGMSRKEIDAAIKRHADYEQLYDKPYEDRSIVRVAGPFTVESLSPHRSLAFAGSEDAEGRESISEQLGAEQPDAPNFEQSVLANLVKAGIQNGRRKERIRFETVEPYAGTYIQAVGVRVPDPAGRAPGGGPVTDSPVTDSPVTDGPVTDSSVTDSSVTDSPVTDGSVTAAPTAPSRVGIAIGPQYGTVGQGFARDAVREAIAARDVDLLAILAFAFDPTVVELTDQDGIAVDASRDGFAEVAAERSFGRIRLLLVRMNVDLLMGDALRKTGAGNLFTVFGEPDIDITRVGDGAAGGAGESGDPGEPGDVVVTLNGVDVYDPTTDEIRSGDTDRIALWMIDTDYNGDSFFVRHCYFTGGNDPYRKLKTALKAEIDPDAWASLNSTVSRPFPAPSTGRIAVKVINDYGDEVMKVFEV